jgi:adenylate cyclase
MYRSKTTILAGLHCEKRQYFTLNRPELARTKKSPLAESGIAVGRQARKEFPGGVLVNRFQEGSDPFSETDTYLIDENVPAIFEAGFRYHDTEVDELMCRFSDADYAVTAASDIQEMLQNRPAEKGFKVQVRIGLHMGQALIREDGDVFGDAVNIAARVTAIAMGGQIITTKDTVISLNPLFQSGCREFDRISLKGKSEETIIYEVLWEKADDVTRMSPMIHFSNAVPLEQQMHLKYLDKVLSLKTQSSVISIGRDARCDFVIKSKSVSRLHAKIEFRRGKFVIIDQSTNGTIVKNSDGKEVYLRREELPLMGNGVISMGLKTDQEEPLQIYFSV